MTPLEHLAFIAVLAALLSAADRLAGGNLIAKAQAWVAWATLKMRPPWLGADLRAIADARSVFWSTLVLAPALAVVGRFTSYGPGLSVLALSVAAWRWDGWTAFGGDIDPRTPAQRLGLFERHMLAVPAFLPSMLFLRGPHLSEAVAEILAMLAFAVLATALGAWLAAAASRGRDINAQVELARGALLGAAIAALL